MFWGGVTETLQQNTDVFNGRPLARSVSPPAPIRGDFERESFIKELTAACSRTATPPR
jgi:hypothetical protein